MRFRAALGATAVVAVALAAAGVALLLVLRANLTGQAELQAEIAAREVAGQLATGVAYDELDLPGEERPVVVVDEDGATLAVGDDVERIRGTAVRASAGDGGTPGPGATADDDSGRADDDSRHRHRGRGRDDDPDDDTYLGDNRGYPGKGEVSDERATSEGTATVDGRTRDYRFVSIEANTPSGEDVIVQAGAPLDAERAAVGEVRTAMLVGYPLLLAVVAAVTWLVTRRALRPVEGIRGEMAAITASADLSRRVPEPDTRDEVARLARTTNRTLAALEASVERQRRFVADASHELRSPIASLRTQLEVGAAHPELLDVAGAVEDTVRLQNLAADLLLLARLDAGERPREGGVADLAALVREECAQRTGDRVPVRLEVPDGPLPVPGSRTRLARVLGNLLDNAQRHAASRVEVVLRTDGDRAVLEVADDGSGVPEAERERIFERFVRLDDARSRDEGGAGLGLAIARDVAASHGGSLTVDGSPAGGALFVLRLPRAGRAGGPGPR